MPGSESARTTRLQSAEAHLYVGSLENACAFYGQKLGFEIVLQYGDPPHFAIIQRDGARFALRLVCEPVFAGDIRAREELLSASIALAEPSDTRDLFAAFDAVGVPFHRRLGSRPWGVIDFIVRDPDGNLLQFVSRAT